jgi:SAM-dependent methyltransferase
MNTFSPEWLTLRETWDHRSRSPEILARLSDWLDRRRIRQSTSTKVLDLGCGTGSTWRYLTRHIPKSTTWTLVDGDPTLLKIAAASTGGATVLADLSIEPLTRIIGAHDLVTASALLDLVSEPWLEALWRTVETSGAGLLAGLTYDGRMAISPSSPFDAVIQDLTNRHQRGDKGFGPALGQRATAALAARARDAGWRVMVRRSDWKLGGDEDRTGLSLLIDGWAAAAREIAPGLSDQIEDWRADRRTSATRITVGHHDLLALPPD